MESSAELKKEELVAKKQVVKKQAVKKQPPKSSSTTRPAGKSVPTTTKKAPPSAPKKAPPARAAAAAQPPARKPVKRRRGDYNFAEDGVSQYGIPKGDLTVRPGTQVELVRPAWDSLDSLIVRPLPAISDAEKIADAQWLPYREKSLGLDSLLPNRFTDWIRSIPAVRSVGIDKERYTFLLYDKGAVKHDPEFEYGQLPYILVWDYANDKNKKRTFPSGAWTTDLTDEKNRDRYLTKPTRLYFFQGLIFKKGNELYARPGSVPKGFSNKDLPQIVQLSSDTGRQICDLLNQVKDEFDADIAKLNFFEEAMVHGDPVHPNFGRFIRIQNPRKGSVGVVESADDADWTQGADAYERRGGGGNQGPQGYVVSVDKVLVSDNRPTAKEPRIPKDHAEKVIKPKIVFWDEVLHYPSVEEQCYIVAKALRGCEALLRRAWADHPEYFTAEVEKVLKNATQILVWDSAHATPAAEPARRRTSAAVPPVDDEQAAADDAYPDDEYADAFGADEELVEEEEEVVEEEVEDDATESDAAESSGDEKDAYEEEYGDDVAAEADDEEAGEDEETEGDEYADGEEAAEEDSEYDFGAFADEEVTDEDEAQMDEAFAAAEQRSSRRRR